MCCAKTARTAWKVKHWLPQMANTETLHNVANLDQQLLWRQGVWLASCWVVLSGQRLLSALKARQAAHCLSTNKHGPGGTLT